MRFLRNNLILVFAWLPLAVLAQAPPVVPAGNLGQLQVAQPLADVTTPVTVTAEFDPPIVQPGQKCFYRATISATESSIGWPDDFSGTDGLKFGVNARGQVLRGGMSVFQPLTVFSYEVTAPAPGTFTVPAFTVNVYGTNALVPAATLQVATNPPDGTPEARRLLLRSSLTNVFAGEPFKVSVLLPLGADGQFENLREIQLNGDGFIVDKSTMRIIVNQPISVEGNPNPVQAFLSEMNVTPVSAGHLKLSAQAFAVGGGFTGLNGRIVVNGGAVIMGGPPHYNFLTSEPMDINVSPLPVAGRPDSFTGAIGQFIIDQPHLSTIQLHTGQPVSLTVGVHGQGDLTRFVPPGVPRSHDWQIIAESSSGINFTLIPRNDEVTATPAIPFSYFDPVAGQYVDVTIPPQPVIVEGDGLPVELTATGDDKASNAPPRLSGLLSGPGWTARSLRPPQLDFWFVGAQLLPVLALLGLLRWDRHRRFLEAHPEIVRRNQARKALRREKKLWQSAVQRRDAPAFAASAVRALQIVCAPFFPAQREALVGADVLSVLDEADRNGMAGEIVRKIFTATDARFAANPGAPADLLALEPQAAAALQKLEEKL